MSSHATTRQPAAARRPTRFAGAAGLALGLALAGLAGCEAGSGAAAPPARAGAHRYRCPMHPELTADSPRARCPKCNMFMNEPVPGAEQLATERQQRIGVRRARVATRTFDGAIAAPAVIALDESRVAHVHTRVAGYVTRLLVSETGTPVRRGQPLLALYSEELVRAQQELLAVRRGAHAPGDRAHEELVAAARRRLALLDMPAGAIAALERRGVPEREVVMRAPLQGHVVTRNVTRGAFVQPGTDLLVVADLGRVWALADVPVRELAALRPGAAARLTLVARPGVDYAGRVAVVYPGVADDTRRARVRVELANPGLALKPGMFGTATLAVAPRTVLAVPAEAIIDSGETHHAFVVRPGGALEPRAVHVGRRQGELLEIRDGLRAGEEIAASAAFLFDSESQLAEAIAGLRRGAPAPAAAPPHQGH